MTRDALASARHEELVELALQAHGAAERAREEAERAQREVERERAHRREIEQQLRWFKRQLFGRKSERQVDYDETRQLCLGEGLAPEREAPERETTVRSHVRRKYPPRDAPDDSGLRFGDSVPMETVVVPNPALEGVPDEECTEITEKVSYRVAQQPAAYKVIKIVRRVVKLRKTGEISCPPAPPAVLEKSYADVSLLAGMLVDKLRYHLPLYRQHQRLKAAGIMLSRASLTSWAAQAAELLDPVYQAQLASILESGVLAMDETPIRAGRKAKGRMHTGYFWPLYGDRHEVAFPYATSRAKRHAEAILGEFCGTLVSDGYEAYEGYAARRAEVVHALCWVHARRGFVKALDVEPERAQTALDWIAGLYAEEEAIRSQGLEGEAKLRARAERSKPWVEGFFAWLDEELAKGALLPSNPFTKAASYARERRRGLEVFLEDPAVPLDTNHLERALRSIPMGRKNWMFCWTELGARQVGQVQSLITTCALHDVDPYTYLVDVLQRVDRHPQARVAELTPRLWKEHFGDTPLRSLLDRPPS